MMNMTRLGFYLLSLLAMASAESVDMHKLLSDLQSEESGETDEHARELWWWMTSDDQREGERCGTRNTCAQGLECTQFAVGGNRCSARIGCLEKELQQFELDFDIQKYKQDILREAGVTQEQIIEAGVGSEGSDLILQNQNVRSFIAAMHHHLGQFDRVDDIVYRCSEQTEDDDTPTSSPSAPGRRLQVTPSPTLSPVPSSQPSASSAPSSKPSVQPSTSKAPSMQPSLSSQPSTSKAPSSQPSTSASPSFTPSMQPSLSKSPSSQPSVSSIPSSTPTAAPSVTPTREPSAAPSAHPTLNPKKSYYHGFSIEGGALMEGSLTVFWEKDSPLDFPPVYVKGCLGVGAAIGADLSFVTIIADTGDPTEIQCLSTMYDVDLYVGLGAGYGIGVCMLTEPPFVYQEIKFGAGLGIGASTFSVCDGAQLSNGYDDGKDSPSHRDNN